MLYSSKIYFKLYATISRRSLAQEVSDGICTQTGTAAGSEKKNPLVVDSTGIFDCESDLNDDADYSEMRADDFVMKLANGNENLSIDVDVNSIMEKGKSLKECTGSEYGNIVKYGGDSYTFIQSRKKCKCKNGVANLNLKGLVSSFDDSAFKKNYTFNTTEDQQATCTLEKEEDSTATLKCNAPTSSKEFNFTEDYSLNTDDDKNSTLYLKTGSGTSLCEVEDGGGVNVPSSSGLSGGAIAGIVIGCVIIMLIVGVIIAYQAIVAKGAAVPAAASSQVIAGTDSHSGFVVPTSVSQANMVH